MWIDRRILFAVAAASLLLNVFLGGAVGGRFFSEHRAAAPPRPVGGPLVPPAHVQALPPDQRKRFRQAMAPHRQAIRLAREAHRAARRQIETDIAAPTFDQAKIDADFQTLRQTNRDTDEAVDAALIEALATLPPEGRAALVAHVRGGDHPDAAPQTAPDRKPDKTPPSR